MVTSTKAVSNEIPSDKVQQRELSDTGFHESVSNKKGSPRRVLSQKELGKVQLIQSSNTEALASQSSQDRCELTMVGEKVSNNFQLTNLNSGNHVSQTNQERSSLSIIPKKESDIMHQSPDSGPDSGIHTSQSNKEGSSLSVIPDIELDNLQQKQRPGSGIHASESNQEVRTVSTTPKKVSYTLEQTQDPDIGVPTLQSDQETFTLAIRPEKVLDKLPLRRNPDIGVHALQSDQGVSFSRIPEKPSEDGYNWRKYGQKLVRGNTFTRSYYKCTFPNCPARKQVERSHDGHITEINYLWKHEHPKPPHTLVKGSAFVLPTQARKPDEPFLTVPEDESSVHGIASHHTETIETPQLSMVAASDEIVEVAISQSNEIKSEVNDDRDPDLKRQKREISSVNDAVVTKMKREPRVVVQTKSEVDFVNDGYRWRKYGQKLVKRNPNPRSYYRCSSSGCPAKKHVERASHDTKVVITTYEGQHDHDIPAGRTVAHNTEGINISTTSPNGGESRPKPEANEVDGLDVVVHVNAN